jgi:hypothetical protein
MSVGGETVKKPHLGRISPPPSVQLWKELPQTPWTAPRRAETDRDQNPRSVSRLVVAWTRVQRTQNVFVERGYTNLMNLPKLGVIRVYVVKLYSLGKDCVRSDEHGKGHLTGAPFQHMRPGPHARVPFFRYCAPMRCILSPVGPRSVALQVIYAPQLRIYVRARTRVPCGHHPCYPIHAIHLCLPASDIR